MIKLPANTGLADKNVPETAIYVPETAIYVPDMYQKQRFMYQICTNERLRRAERCVSI